MKVRIAIFLPAENCHTPYFLTFTPPIRIQFKRSTGGSRLKWARLVFQNGVAGPHFPREKVALGEIPLKQRIGTRNERFEDIFAIARVVSEPGR